MSSGVKSENDVVYVPMLTSNTPPPGGKSAAAGQRSPVDGAVVQPRNSAPCRQSCWKRRTLLEKRLLVLLVFVVILCVVLLVIAIAMFGQQAKKDEPTPANTTSTCLSEHCVKTASRMIESMDQTVDPCDDFFEYACGTWNRVNLIPDDRSVYNTFRKLDDELQATLKVLLEDPQKPGDPQAIGKLKGFYQSCMNTTRLEELQERPLLDHLRSIGLWPVASSQWNESGFDLESTMAKLRFYGNRAFVNFAVGPDDRDSDVSVLMVDQPPLGLPSREYFLRGRSDKVLATYEEYAVEVAVALGANRSTAVRDIADMIDLEIRIANITSPDENRRDAEALYAKYTVAQLSTEITSDFNWLKYMRAVFNVVDIHIAETDAVVVYAKSYLRQLGTLLRKTPKRTIANYLVWVTVINRISLVHQKFLDMRRNLNKVLQGVDQEPARWRTCVSNAKDHFTMAIGRLFVQKHFNEESKATALEMIQNIRSAFVELLDEVPWMDKDTKVVAREKADAIQERIGYPDYILNDTALDLDYEGLQINPHSFFDNVVSSLLFAVKMQMRTLRRQVDKSRWSSTPAVVNAFYSASRNQIIFPAGILQPPFYHGNHPKYLQFSGIAIAVAHEITHGFDDEGRQFDKDGNLKQWWSNDVIERFKEKAQCIIDQYSNYTIAEVGMQLNGRQTQGENIADNGGLKQAFRAYKRWTERTGQAEYLLPGVRLTQKQLFFLNFAQIWCGTQRPESLVQSLRIGRHSPGRYRVIGTLSNSYDFAEAFNCPVGTPMNPRHKCSVW